MGKSMHIGTGVTRKDAAKNCQFESKYLEYKPPGAEHHMTFDTAELRALLNDLPATQTEENVMRTRFYGLLLSMIDPNNEAEFVAFDYC